MQARRSSEEIHRARKSLNSQFAQSHSLIRFPRQLLTLDDSTRLRMRRVLSTLRHSIGAPNLHLREPLRRMARFAS